jgi:hypothetical protein
VPGRPAPWELDPGCKVSCEEILGPGSGVGRGTHLGAQVVVTLIRGTRH